jgi:hypothetical protein
MGEAVTGRHLAGDEQDPRLSVRVTTDAKETELRQKANEVPGPAGADLPGRRPAVMQHDDAAGENLAAGPLQSILKTPPCPMSGITRT